MRAIKPTIPRINELSRRVLRAAQDTFGDKLDKVMLYGSYARGDFDEESDVDFFILADVPQEEASARRREIRDRLPGIDLEYDVAVSLHVTGSSVYYQYIDTLPFYINVSNEGVLLNDEWE